MNNPMSYIAAGATSSLKIDKLSLQQQLMKRYEVMAAQKSTNSSTLSTTKNVVSYIFSLLKYSVNHLHLQKKPAPANTAAATTTIQPKLIIDNTIKVPLAFRQRYLNFIYQESKPLFPNCEKACEKASEQEKSIYDRAKTKNIYANLAVHLIKSLRQQNQKATPAATITPGESPKTSSKQVETNKNNLKLVNYNRKDQQKSLVPQKPSYSHDAILAGPKASKVSYSINRKKKLTLKELNCKKGLYLTIKKAFF